MKKSKKIAGATIITVLGLLCIVAGYLALKQDVGPTAAKSPAVTAPAALAEGAHESFLYGRITAVDGITYEGRLRWGGDEEAFWGNYFNGVRNENSWVTHVPRERLPKELRPIEIFGWRIATREHAIDLGRPFMMRFGDIARIEAGVRDVRATLKSGTTYTLDRFSASDFDDGVRVWDDKRGVVDLDSLQIRVIEFLPNSRTGGDPNRLHGTVHTRQGKFTGFLQWGREECVGADELDLHTAEDDLRLRFDAIRSIARRSRDSSVVTLLDGREIVLPGSREVGKGSRGVYVDDPRYGRVLISWGAFESLDFSHAGNGPSYGDFPPGGPLTGAIITRDGRRFAGKLVYDLDESEITDTLDAPSQGVNYAIPFGLIASIMLPLPEQGSAQRARVTLHRGEELQLECTGDLGGENAGILIFVDGRQQPEYVVWADVKQVVLNRPDATYPPLVI